MQIFFRIKYKVPNKDRYLDFYIPSEGYKGGKYSQEKKYPNFYKKHTWKSCMKIRMKIHKWSIDKLNWDKYAK